jgi:hypothetical protein
MNKTTDKTKARTVLRRLEQCARIGDVAGWLTSEMLEMKTTAERTVLFYAVRDGLLNLLPPGTYRPKWMSRKFRGRTLAQILTEGDADYVSSHMADFHEKVRAVLLARLLAA